MTQGLSTGWRPLAFCPFGGGDWISYRIKKENKLVFKNVKTGFTKEMQGVKNYFCSEQGYLLYQTSLQGDDGNFFCWVHGLDLSSLKEKDIWSDSADRSGTIELKKVAFNGKGDRLSFIIQHIDAGHVNNSVWYYNAPAQRVFLVADNGTRGGRGGK